VRADLIRIGTSGWQYRDWRGVLYPAELRQKLWLEWYAQHFPVVEVDATFYRLPESWQARTPDDFRFVIKASRYLTHIKRLQEPQEPVERLLDRAHGLGPKLAAVLLQLPPTLPAAPGLLAETLSAFGNVPVAVEPHNETWWSDTVADIMRDHRATTVWADRRNASVGPRWLTADWGYVRLHEGRSSPWPHYGHQMLRSWAGRLFEAAPEWNEGFVFFNNDPGGAAVRNARYLSRRLAAGARRREPNLIGQ
jgi:uncharacterized protein YecE (DUF72 family)